MTGLLHGDMENALMQQPSHIWTTNAQRNQEQNGRWLDGGTSEMQVIFWLLPSTRSP